jgi:cation/acetate symporter
MSVVTKPAQASFFSRLLRFYSVYTGGVVAFIICMAGLEWSGVPNRYLGYLFLFATILIYAGIGF